MDWRLTQTQAQRILEATRGVRFLTPQIEAQGERGARPEDLNHLLKKKEENWIKNGSAYLVFVDQSPLTVSQTLALLCCPFSAPFTSIWALFRRHPGTILSVYAFRLLLRHLLRSSSPFFFFPCRAWAGLSLKPFFAPFFSIFSLFLGVLLTIGDLCLWFMERCFLSLLFFLFSLVFFFPGSLFIASGLGLLLCPPVFFLCFTLLRDDLGSGQWLLSGLLTYSGQRAVATG